MVKTLRVTGEAKISVKPDVVVLSFPLAVSHTYYNTAVKNLNERLEVLRTAVVVCGMKREDLKTTSFSVRKETEWDHSRATRIFTGYEASHDVKLEFLYDKSYLNQVLSKILETCTDVEFKIDFKASPSSAKIAEEEMLSLAVSNAHKNATILADSAGIKLGSIINIDYSHSTIRYEEEYEIETHARYCEQAAPIEIEPENLKGKKTVTITWLIEDK
ncbi:MAG: SIMPL domain-containing protein [Candidatus Cloacimonetes bacterium]|nr:SIMPL domain-containing protein [Candidatus Cloacimonadota bacterium]